MLLLQSASASASVTTAAAICLCIGIMAAAALSVCLLTALAPNMRRARLAECSTMSTLRDWTALLVNVLQWPIRVLAVADTMTSYACLAGILFAFDQHRGMALVVVDED